MGAAGPGIISAVVGAAVAKTMIIDPADKARQEAEKQAAAESSQMQAQQASLQQQQSDQVAAQANQTAQLQARARQRAMSTSGQTPNSTILTSPLGDVGAANTANKQLLGT